MKLSYRDEEDKCYGVTGMAMAIVIFDGEDMLARINIDAPADEVIEFSDDFYFSGNPGMSAKSSWNKLLTNFNITMAMSISNVMCRRMVHDHKDIDAEMVDYLHDVMLETAMDQCSLENDETERLFNKNYNYLHRVFSHSGVAHVANDFARQLQTRRSLSRMDVMELLQALAVL